MSLLALAAIDAVLRNSNEELTALLSRRSEAIHALSHSGIELTENEASLLAKSSEALLGTLREARRDLVKELKLVGAGANMRRTYGASRASAGHWSTA